MAYANGERRSSLTVAVLNLKNTVTRPDVVEFFRTHTGDPDPRVHELVQNGKDYQATTVTFTCKSKSAGIKTCEDIHELKLTDGRSNVSEVSVNSTFHGLTTLCEMVKTKGASPKFDVVFVHGLRGHAWKTWSSKKKSQESTRMWPRDVLPQYLQERGLYGRYITYGYDAKMFKNSMSNSIEIAAREILNNLSFHESRDVDTPLFFICHSLGGLVVSRAVVDALSSKHMDEKLQKRLFHSKSEECLIKGIVYFGTPFEGSALANIFAKLARLPPGQPSEFIQSLRLKNKDVAETMERFKSLRRQQKSPMPLCINYEKRKVKKFYLRFMVTTHKSATNTFKDEEGVKCLEINKDHRNCVKFSTAADIDFQQRVGQSIKDLISDAFLPSYQKTLKEAFPEEPNTIQLSDQDLKENISWFQKRFQENSAERSLNEARIEQPNLSASAFSLNTFCPPLLQLVVTDMTKQNREGILEKELEKIGEPLPDTCDWILEEELYQNWESSKTNSVLVIEGTMGVGKSVLARYLVHRLQGKFTSAAIILVNCRSHGLRSTPAYILRLIIWQLELQKPGLVLQAIIRHPGRVVVFDTNAEVDFLWHLLLAMREELPVPIFCVLDGLDECIRGEVAQSNSSNGSELKKFLERLSRISHAQVPKATEDSPNLEQLAKVLLTIRPDVEITSCFPDRGVFISMRVDDVQKRSMKLLQDGVSSLELEQGQSDRLKALIVNNLSEKLIETDSPFQWVKTTVEQLKTSPLASEETVVNRLDLFGPGLFSVYFRIIESICVDKLLGTLTASLIRLLIFSYRELTIFEVAHALSQSISILNDPSGFASASAPTVESTITALRGLVQIEKGFIRFGHDSVRDFFLNLYDKKLLTQGFDYKNTEDGHAWMARICLSCALRLDPQEFQDNLGSNTEMLLKKHHFLEYSYKYWTSHVADCPTSNEILLDLVGELLQENTACYLTMLENQEFVDLPKDIHKYISPPNFLALKGLTGLLKAVPFQKRVSTGSILKPWKKGASKHAKSLKPFQFSLEIDKIDITGQNIFHYAAASGSRETVHFLLCNGASGRTYDSEGRTAFSIAVERGHKEIAEYLIERTQAIERIRKQGTAHTLHMACYHGWDSVVQYLLDHGTNVNARCLGVWTPLHVAGESENISTAILLIKNGAELEAEGDEGMRPIHYAARFGSVEMIQILLEHKSDLHVGARATKNSLTPIYLAAQGGHLATYEFLAQRSGVFSGATAEGLLPLHTAARNGHANIVEYILNHDSTSISAWTKRGRRPIHYAAANGSIEVVNMLLSHDALLDDKALDLECQPGTEPSYSITPLGIALACSHSTLARHLLRLKANPRSFMQATGNTVLHLAASAGDIVLFQELIEKHGMELEAVNKYRRNSFHMAAGAGHTDILEYICRSELSYINRRDSFNQTALMFALEGKHVQAAMFLLDRGASLDEVSSDTNTTTLMLAAAVKPSYLLERILSLQTLDVNSRAADGDTALMSAVKAGIVENVEKLILARADIDIPRTAGHTPLYVAVAMRHEECARILIERKANSCALTNTGVAPIDLLRVDPKLKHLVPLVGGSSIPKATREKRLLQSLTELLESPPQFTSGRDRDFREIIWFCNLGDVLLRARKSNHAKVCYEQCSVRLFDNTARIRLTCDCENTAYGTGHACKTCLEPTFHCRDCFETLEEEGTRLMCSWEHEFLEFCGDDWEALDPDKVNEDGDTIEDWYQKICAEYGINRSTDE